jgi:HD-like signal output (HDOD) protein
VEATVSIVPPSLEKVLVQCATLPSLPAVAVEILAECRKDDVSLDRLGELLQRDPALATKLLSVANSSAYRRGSPITTIRRATISLGANAVMALALSFSLCSQRPGKGSFDFPGFWRRALLSALCARVLARWAQIEPEEALLGGLLQDVGILALQTSLPGYDLLFEESRGDHVRLERLEREQFGAGHPEVGAWLAARLRLPPALVHAVLTSHAAAASEAGMNFLDRCVAVSGRMAETWLSRLTTASSVGAEAASSHLGLQAAEYDALLAEVGAAAQSFAASFDVALPSPDEMHDIVQQARQTLVRVPTGAGARPRG